MNDKKPLCRYSLFRSILLLIIMLVCVVIIVDAMPLFVAG